jgi:transcriptional regulator with XRE-family HTH domain
MIIKNFYEKIKILRKTKKISQANLAEILGLSRTAITKMETNQSNTTLENAVNIADYFDVSLDYLCGRTDKRKGKNCTKNA